MNAKKKAKSMDPIQQAELILHLYELRRETVMREARSYVGGEFMPASAEDFIQIVSAGGKLTGFVCRSTNTGTWSPHLCKAALLTPRSYTTPARKCTSNTRRFSHTSRTFGKRSACPSFL
jgi:hypothetical protein